MLTTSRLPTLLSTARHRCLRGALPATLALLTPPAAIAGTLGVPGEYGSLAEALTAASSGDTVLVAPGTYVEADLVLPGGVTMRAQDGATVTLDADRAGRHLVVEAGDGAIVESFRFVNGITVDRKRRDGGSVLVLREAEVTLRNCSFDDMLSSRWGGAIAVESDASLVLEGCSFANCEATQRVRGAQASRRLLARDAMSNGGAVALGRRTRLVATDCSFTNCRTKDSGGAVFLEADGTASLLRCTFDGGHAHDGGAIAGDGASIDVTDCTFRNHVARPTFRSPARGGAIHVHEGELHVTGGSFQKNVAGQGGAVMALRGRVAVIEGVHFSGNEAEGGGAVMATATELTVRNSTFHANAATKTNGGAVLVGVNGLEIEHCSFYGNSAMGRASSIYVSAPRTVLVDSCIFAAGRGASAVEGSDQCTLTFRCTDQHGNEGGDWPEDQAEQAAANGNFSADPRFRDPASGDLSLADGSPCLNKGECGRIGAGAASP